MHSRIEAMHSKIEGMRELVGGPFCGERWLYDNSQCVKMKDAESDEIFHSYWPHPKEPFKLFYGGAITPKGYRIGTPGKIFVKE